MKRGRQGSWQHLGPHRRVRNRSLRTRQISSALSLRRSMHLGRSCDPRDYLSVC